MPNVLFRADAEKSIGIGDLKSLIYLSKEFQKNSWDCHFIIRDYEPALKIIEQHKLKNVFLIPNLSSVDDETEFIKKICKDRSVDCLFMEVTKYSLSEYKNLGKPAPIKACVNFDGKISDDFDVVVNWCIDSSSDLYSSYSRRDINFMLGFENAVIPDYFDWGRIQKRHYGKEVKNILISMGGVDEFRLTEKILAVLNQNMHDFKIRAIIGPGYANPQEPKKLNYGKEERIFIKENTNNLFDDYLWADLAFSAGGITASELFAAKTPSILIAGYEHQVNRCEYYLKNGWAYYLGYCTEIDKNRISRGLSYMLDNINLFRKALYHNDFRGGNEKIFKNINSCR